MSSDHPDQFFALFPFFLVAAWLAVTTVLGIFSGWFALQRRYGRPNEEPLLKLRGRSGSMGLGVGLQGALNLSAHRSGLGVGIVRILGPFQRPFLVPWSEIEAEPMTTLFTPVVKLRFGRDAAGSLKVSARSWSRLVEAARCAAVPALPPAPAISDASLARGLILEWLAFTALIASFFYFVSRLPGAGDPIPIESCIGLPAAFIALVQVVKYLRER